MHTTEMTCINLLFLSGYVIICGVTEPIACKLLLTGNILYNFI